MAMSATDEKQDPNRRPASPSPSVAAPDADAGAANKTNANIASSDGGDEKQQGPALDTSGSDIDGLKPDPATSEDTHTPAEHEYIDGWRLFAVLTALTLTCFLMLLDMSIVATAIPRITTEFHSLEDVGWYGAAYNLASGALQPLAGKFYTYFKSKWTFLIFVFIFTLGSLLCGVATSSNMLIVGRAVAGMGTSGIQNGAMTIISNSLPLEKRPMHLGILLGFGQLGIVIGPLLGGAITEYSTWRWCFYLNLPCTAAVGLVLWFTHIPERVAVVDHSAWETVRTKLDLSGFVMFAPAAVMFLLGLEYGGGKYSWSSATVLGLLIGSVALFAIFFFWERKQGDTAMFPFSMLRRREVWTSMLTGMFILGGVIFIPAFYLPIYFQSVKGDSPFTSGIHVLPNILMSTFFAVLSGALVTRLGYYIPWVLFSAAAASIACGLLSTLGPDSTTAQWVGYQILLGSRGASLQMPMIAIQKVLPQSKISVAMALLVFAQTFGSAVFLTISQTIFSNSLSKYVAEYAPNVNFGKLLAAGATGVHGVVSDADLPGVLLAYANSVDRVFYFCVAAAVAAFCAAWGMGWHDLRVKHESESHA
ncbi:major facilitator superfamily-domain-containing protein [Lasiosphaeria miniovina]|uniref:Major facilitator superfamily-domain-containing protein n=1 Tax=Lasiosphaeria miniovina TaxID=1954250 RepID=A0AA40DNB9_9PEZI|nr:major facilitator superfamily-domain-containing protein [Lasiosphaeria miniovina]KAK0710044.1 major facilitator superfamily-domain-containing protein [Lasiosphaeria miniovina]